MRRFTVRLSVASILIGGTIAAVAAARTAGEVPTPVPVPANVSASEPVQLVETRPIESGLGNPNLPAALDVWLDLIRNAKKSLFFEEFYLSTWPGEPMTQVLDEIGKAAKRGVQVRLLLDSRMHRTYPQPADSLATVPGIELRVIDMGKVA